MIQSKPNLSALVMGILFSLLLSACGNNEPTKQESKPEDAAIAFFDALYNQNDLNKAVKYATPQTTRIMLHYKTAKAVQRHFINMKFDTVDISVDTTGRGEPLVSASATKAKVTLYFDGTYDGRTIRDLKTIELEKQLNEWKVKKIKADPYRR